MDAEWKVASSWSIPGPTHLLPVGTEHFSASFCFCHSLFGDSYFRKCVLHRRKCRIRCCGACSCFTFNIGFGMIIMKSRNGLGWKGPYSSSISNPWMSAGCRSPAQGANQPSLGHLQSWGILWAAEPGPQCLLRKEGPTQCVPRDKYLLQNCHIPLLFAMKLSLYAAEANHKVGQQYSFCFCEQRRKHLLWPLWWLFGWVIWISISLVLVPQHVAYLLAFQLQLYCSTFPDLNWRTLEISTAGTFQLLLAELGAHACEHCGAFLSSEK